MEIGSEPQKSQQPQHGNFLKNMPTGDRMADTPLAVDPSLLVKTEMHEATPQSPIENEGPLEHQENLLSQAFEGHFMDLQPEIAVTGSLFQRKRRAINDLPPRSEEKEGQVMSVRLEEVAGRLKGGLWKE